MSKEREVAGIRCSQVLERLGAYVDGELELEQREQVESHLAGCNWCESFGKEYAQTVVALRRALCAPEPLNDATIDRLRERLNENG